MATVRALRAMSQRCLSLFSTHTAVTPVAELASLQRLGLPSLASEDAFVPGRDMVSSLFLRSFSVACLYGRRDVGFSPRFWCLEASSGSHGGGLLLNDREEVSSSLTSVRQFAKRAKKWHGDPYAWLPVPPEGEQVPPSQPNAGSVKNRNHQKRMAQRAEFGKLQAKTRKEQQKAVNMLRDAARRKRWKEGAARANAWAELQAERAQGNTAMQA
jgi:hypothetical protein